MKKSLLVCAAVIALLTHAHAFNFGGMFSDMKDSAISVKNSAKDSVETIKEDAILKSDDAETDEDLILKAETKFEEEKKSFAEKLEKLIVEKEKLSKELSTLKEENKVLHSSLIKRESEKNTLEHYMELLAVTVVLLLLFLFLLWRTKREKKN